MSLFFILSLIDRWWGLWTSYESQPFRNEDPFTSYFEWKGVCHQHRYVKKRYSISTHQIQCNTIFILIQRYIKHWFNVINFFFTVFYILSIPGNWVTFNKVLSVLLKGSIYCAHEILESGAKTRNFHFEKNYKKWCSKICSLCFVYQHVTVRYKCILKQLDKLVWVFFSKKLHTDCNLKLRVTGECHCSRDFMKEMVLIDVKYNINNLLVFKVMHS